MDAKDCQGPLTSKKTTLKEKATELQLRYLMPMVPSISYDCRGCLVPVSSASNLENNGFGFFGVDHYKTPMNDEEQFGIPDVETLIKLPWKPDVGFVICNLHHHDKPFAQCPRTKLLDISEKTRQMGYVMKCGVEPEFILLKKDKHEGLDIAEKDFMVYHKPSIVLERMGFLDDCITVMDKLGWEPYQAEHEAISNQYELNFGYADAAVNADRQFFMKFMIKELAVKHGFRATFMPAPFPGKPMGSGLHMNLSLWDAKTGKSLFPDDSEETGISKVAQHFTAGILAHARALTAILCPNINSYKRLHASTLFSTGKVVSWGVASRLPMIRIPAPNRIELRIGDGSGNPYLMHAAVMAAGLHGIHDKMTLDEGSRLQEDVTNDVPDDRFQKIPKTLAEALDCLEQDEHLKEWLGKELVEGFVYMKRTDWVNFMKTVTPYEIELADEY